MGENERDDMEELVDHEIAERAEMVVSGNVLVGYGGERWF